MAPVKRKGAPALLASGGSAHKRPRKDIVSQRGLKKTPCLEQNLEVETDSDPIVESDTSSRSGDDDGSSWPSDRDTGESGGFVEEIAEEDNPPIGEGAAAENGNPCKYQNSMYLNNYSHTLSIVLKRISCETKSPSTRAQSFQT